MHVSKQKILILWCSGELWDRLTVQACRDPIRRLYRFRAANCDIGGLQIDLTSIARITNLENTFLQRYLSLRWNTQRLQCVHAVQTLRRLPFDEKFRFAFPEISCDECNLIFHKRGQLCQVFQKFCKFNTRTYNSIWLPSWNFGKCRLNGSLSGNSTMSGFSAAFVIVSKMSKSLVEWIVS